MYCEEVPLSCKYFTKIRQRKVLPEPHLCFWTCIRASHRAEGILCSPMEKCWVVTPAWGSPAPGGRNLVLRCAELNPSMCATDRSGRAVFGTERAFLSQSPSELLWWICIVPYPVDSSVLVSSWGNDGADGRSAHSSLLRRTFFFPPRQSNLEEESLLPPLHCRGQRNTVKLQMVPENFHFSLRVVSRAD